MNRFFAVIAIVSLFIIACDSNNASNENSCTVTYTANTMSVYQNVPGIGTYEVYGVYNSSYGGIDNSYKETYTLASDAESQCDEIIDDDWYSNVECMGNLITYEDFNEVSIQEQVADYQEMCDFFLENY